MMMQSHRNLNQSLQKLFFGRFGLSPNILPDFVGVIKMALVKEFDPAMEAFFVHAQILQDR